MRQGETLFFSRARNRRLKMEGSKMAALRAMFVVETGKTSTFNLWSFSLSAAIRKAVAHAKEYPPRKQLVIKQYSYTTARGTYGRGLIVARVLVELRLRVVKVKHETR